MQDYLVHEQSLSAAWREAATFLQTTVVVTPDEMEKLGEQIHALLAPYFVGAREKKPRGARIAHFSVRAVPKP